MASVIWRPPVYQGPRGSKRPDGLRGFFFDIDRIVQAKSIHHQHLKSEQKARLRAEAISLRKEIWLKHGPAAALAIAEKGVPLVESFGPSGPVGGYCALRCELDPLPLLASLDARGFRIALPRSEEGTALSFREWKPGGALERGRFGVAEPTRDQPAMLPPIIFVPLVAFDREGNRLGYGAGYYDACLRDMRARQRMLAVGLAFDEQEVPEIPREPQDEPLNMVLTPSRVIACGG